MYSTRQHISDDASFLADPKIRYRRLYVAVFAPTLIFCGCQDIALGASTLALLPHSLFFTPFFGFSFLGALFLCGEGVGATE